MALKLQSGKISQVPLSRLSAEDNAFIKAKPLVHHPDWKQWPPDADYAMRNVPVKNAPGDGGAFVYTTPHFRFISNVNLGTALVKDLARVFELAHREGILDMLVRQNVDISISSGSRSVVGMGERIKLQKSDGGPPLRKVEKVLMMTDEEWITGRTPGTPAPSTAPDRGMRRRATSNTGRISPSMN